MRRSFLLPLIALAMTLSTVAVAAPPSPATKPAPPTAPADEGPLDETEACLDKADTQADMNACAKAAGERADRRLATVTRRLAEVLDDVGKARLDRAVKAFEPWRSAACEVDGDTVRGGSMEPLVVGMCRADLANFWADGLEQLLADRASK
jgi:uncharacterized protein YecT (DUF1311 family)